MDIGEIYGEDELKSTRGRKGGCGGVTGGKIVVVTAPCSSSKRDDDGEKKKDKILVMRDWPPFCFLLHSSRQLACLRSD